jgi:hypothetical protein
VQFCSSKLLPYWEVGLLVSLKLLDAVVERWTNIFGKYFPPTCRPSW